MVKGSFKPSKKSLKTAQRHAEIIRTLEAVKMISIYVLRNQGWGKERLSRFSEKFNEYAVDVGDGLFSLSDILEVIKDETGLTIDDLKLP